MSLDTVPLSAALGAEIRGIDLAEPIGPALGREIESTLWKYGVVFFRNQQLSLGDQEAFIRLFGPPNRPAGNANTDRFGSPYFFDVSNVDGEGRIMQLGDDRRHYLLANLLWHSDMSMRQPPARVTALWAQVLPEVDAPDTEFVDTRLAWELLPAETKAEIDGLMVEHSVIASREKVGAARSCPLRPRPSRSRSRSSSAPPPADISTSLAGSWSTISASDGRRRSSSWQRPAPVRSSPCAIPPMTVPPTATRSS